MVACLLSLLNFDAEVKAFQYDTEESFFFGSIFTIHHIPQHATFFSTHCRSERLFQIFVFPASKYFVLDRFFFDKFHFLSDTSESVRKKDIQF